MDTEERMETGHTASVIERGQSEGRLGIDGHDLHCGEMIEVWTGDLGWLPARVETSESLGWVGYLRDGWEGDGHTGAVLVFLHPGVQARRLG